MSEFDLVGKTAVVLGASNPYGAAAARLLAGEGVNLALGGRDRERLEALQAEVEVAGGEALVVGTHLAKRHHPVHLVEAAVEQFGGLDYLLFMAYSGAPPLTSQEVVEWERSVDVNIKGFLYCLAAALPALRVSGGHVVALGAEEPGLPDPLHRAARAAVSVLVEELNAEFSEEEVSASVVLEQDPDRCAEAVRQALLYHRR